MRKIPVDPVRLFRYCLLTAVSLLAVALHAAAGLIVAGFYLPSPASMVAGFWVGAGAGAVMVCGFYTLGRRDGAAAGFRAGCRHRDSQQAHQVPAAGGQVRRVIAEPAGGVLRGPAAGRRLRERAGV